MKKFLLLSVALLSVSATAAQAQVNLDVNFGGPAYVEQPQPVYVDHPYVPHHYNGRDRHREGRDWRDAHEEHHDNGRHLGEFKHDEYYR